MRKTGVRKRRLKKIKVGDKFVGYMTRGKFFKTKEKAMKYGKQTKTDFFEIGKVEVKIIGEPTRIILQPEEFWHGRPLNKKG